MTVNALSSPTSGFNGPAKPARVAESLKVPARVWRAVFEGFLEDDVARELGKIKAPTLIVWGARDALSPRRDQDALVTAIAGSRLLVYERAGHGLHWEEPERFAADLVAFVRSLGVLRYPRHKETST